ncbi:MAG: hypothetical protein ACRDG8_00930 [Actinomycetota bacterium]
MPLVAAGLVLLLAIGVFVFLTRDGDPPERAAAPGDEEPTVSDGDVATPTTPAFRFAKISRTLVRTAPGHIGTRRRAASTNAAAAARDVLTDLYTEGFLDPVNLAEGRYTDAFRGFASKARREAERRPALLTAGPRAGERYERIVTRSSRLATRILVDRVGTPTLLVSYVEFSALASGPEPVLLRSSGQFFFERVRGSWKIVSFHVIRRDAPQEVA